LTTVKKSFDIFRLPLYARRPGKGSGAPRILAMTARQHIRAREPQLVRVMSFNVFWQEAELSREHVARTVLAAQADVVGLQEADVAAVARDLGWHHDARAGVVSRWPVEAASSHVCRVRLPATTTTATVTAGSRTSTLLATSLHLPARLYGPSRLASGVPPARVEADERASRLPALAVRLESIDSLAPSGAGEPCVVTGDLNAPSHLDRQGVSWPVSRALERAGFVDAYRTSRGPDARGETWWASRQEIRECRRDMPCTRREPSARIDYVLVRGAVDVIDCVVIGESEHAADVVVRPWRSDHRAVLATLLL
jgi:endonuclease/exonuclease/phosphatase family metal-dependent hydrolase